MKRFRGFLVFCFVSVFLYAQEPLNFNPKYRTDSLERETKHYHSASLLENQAKLTPSGLKMRISYGASSQHLTKSDSQNQAPKKEEEFIEKKEQK